jgi:hypothetical protein
VGRRRIDRLPDGLRLPDRLHVGVFDGVVVLVLAGDRAFELADAFAQAVAELRQAFGAEHDQRDDEHDDDLKGADISEHLVNGNESWSAPDQL